jgi:hypothetical protein
VIIEGHVPLDCEHAFGPSFTLSPNDHTKLEGLLAEAKRSAVMDAVGWYHSHTRSEIFFSPADIEVHNRFFPKLWHVALVVRPRTLGPAGAGFFFRETNGSIHGEASYAEFTLQNLPLRAAAPLPARTPRMSEPFNGDATMDLEPALESAVRSPIPIDIATPAASPRARMGSAVPVEEVEPIGNPGPRLLEMEPEEAEVAAAEPVWEASANEVAEPDTAEPDTAEPVAAEPDFVEPEGVEPGIVESAAAEDEPPMKWHAPNFTVEAPRSNAWMASVGLTVGLALGAIGFQTRNLWLPKTHGSSGTPQSQVPAQSSSTNPPPLQISPNATVNFNAKDSDGQLLFAWDRTSPLILGSTGALLIITDGSTPPQAIGLDSVHLKAGNFTYARESGHVDATLTVHLPNGQDLKEIATFLGKNPRRTAGSEPPGTDQTKKKASKQTANVEKRASRRGRSPEELREELDRELLRRRLSNQAPDAVKQ